MSTISTKSNLLDLSKLFVGLQAAPRQQLIHDLEPLFGGEIIDVLVSAPQALKSLIEDAAKISKLDTNLEADADRGLSHWSKVWRRIGKHGKSTRGILCSPLLMGFWGAWGVWGDNPKTTH